MKYEFHVGDYVETIGGFVGWICRTRDDGYIWVANKDIASFCYRMPEQLEYFNRIGQYDFTKKNKVEPLLINKNVSLYCGNGKTNSPSDYKKVFEQNELNDKVIDKINELVDAVNILRKRERT